jgi:hypothetical protein
MALLYYGIAVLSLIGAGAVIYWIRKSDEGFTIGIVIMVGALVVLGFSMLVVGLTSS